MARLVRLKDLMSEYYSGVLEMETLLEVEQYELDELQSAIDRQAGNQFVMTADADGIVAWESMVGIETLTSMDLETRRYNVLARLLPPKPMTITYLSELLEMLNINAKLVKNGTFSFNVEFNATDDGAADRLNLLLKQIMPANLVFNTINKVASTKQGTAYLGAGSLKEIERTNTEVLHG